MTPISPILTELERHRQQFPALANKAYFNYGGQGPMPESAIAAILQGHQTVQQVGPFSGSAGAWMAREAQQMRQAIAHELQVPVGTMTLTEDVTVGCNIPLWGIDWQAGDHILLSDCEHPGIIATVQEIQRRFGIEISFCPIMQTLNQGDPVAIIAEHLRPTTRLLIVSHILWNTGQVLPLADIVAKCHQHVNPLGRPVLVLVDAAQSVGVLPLNLTEIAADFYAFTGHKWWCGPAGLGGLYVRPEALDSTHPTFIGWKSITMDSAGYPTGWQTDGQRFEIATSDFTLYGALREAIALHNYWGTAQARYQRICDLSSYLWQRLSELPSIRCLRTAPPEAGLVSFQVKGAEGSDPQKSDHQKPDHQKFDHQKIVQALEQQNLMLRTIRDPDCMRACVHYFTLESEIDRLIEAIQQLVS